MEEGSREIGGVVEFVIGLIVVFLVDALLAIITI